MNTNTNKSERQAAANRRNAKKSTGPKTKDGKLRSSRNALKHGLLTSNTVLSIPDFNESLTDFEEMLASLREELRPGGLLEEGCVAHIASIIWRLNRARRAEKGAIEDQFYQDLDDYKEKMYRAADACAENPGRQDLFELFSSSPHGLKSLIDSIDEAKNEISNCNRINESVVKRLVSFFGRSHDEFAFNVKRLASVLDYENSQTTPKAPGDLNASAEQDIDMLKNVHSQMNANRVKRNIIELLDSTREKLEEMKSDVSFEFRIRRSATLDLICMPDGQGVAKITRYETSLLNQLRKETGQLHKLQDRRKPSR